MTKEVFFPVVKFLPDSVTGLPVVEYKVRNETKEEELARRLKALRLQQEERMIEEGERWERTKPLLDKVSFVLAVVGLPVLFFLICTGILQSNW